MHRWEWWAMWGRGAALDCGAVSAITSGYPGISGDTTSDKGIPADTTSAVTRGRQRWRTTRLWRRTPVRWWVPEGEWVPTKPYKLWSDRVILRRSNWITLMWKVKMFLKKVLLIDRQWEMDTDFKGIAAAVLYVPWLRKVVQLVREHHWKENLGVPMFV